MSAKYIYIKFDLKDRKKRRDAYIYIETLTSVEGKKGDDSREADVLLRGGIDLIDERKRNRNPRNPVIETVRGLLLLLPIPRVRAVARSLINVVRLPIRRIIFASGSGRNRKAGLETRDRA